MKRAVLVTSTVVAAVLVAAPASHAVSAGPQLTVSLSGKAVTVTGTPAAGADTFNYVYTGTSAEGSAPTVVKLGPNVTPDAFMAQVKAQKADAPVDDLLASTQSVLLTGGAVAKGAAKSSSVAVLDAGATYVVADTESDNPADYSYTSFVVPAAPATGAALPKAAHTITLKDFKISVPKTLPRKTTLKVVNAGPSPHFVLAVSVPKGKTFKQALKALGKGNEKFFAKSRFAAIVPLVSGGTTSVENVKLAKGKWVFACLYANAASKGKLHAMLGMEKGVTVK